MARGGSTMRVTLQYSDQIGSSRNERAYIRTTCGLLLPWVEAIPEDEDLIEGLTELYGGGKLAPIQGGNINEETGEYAYPCDPILSPVCKVEREQETVYIYTYGILSIVYNDNRPPFITRLD